MGTWTQVMAGAVAVALMSVSATAMADFKIVKAKPKPVVAKAATSHSAAESVPLRVSGAACTAGVGELRGAPGKLRPLVTPGGNEPAVEAIEKIVPPKWTVTGVKSGTAKIQWSAGGSWLDVADRIAKKANLCLDVHFDDRIVHVMRAPAAGKAKVGAVVGEATGASAKGSGKAAATSGAKPTPPAITTVRRPVYRVDEKGRGAMVSGDDTSKALYRLVAGSTLRETLVKWTHQAGWQLVWQSDNDYPIAVNMTFAKGTSFEDAVRTLLKAYWRQKYALEGRMYQNRVLEIIGRAR